MFNKTITLKFSEFSTIRKMYPNAGLKDIATLKKTGTLDDIVECSTKFPNADITDIEAIVSCRSFIRWYNKNSKVINLLLFAVPSFALAVHGLAPDAFTFDILRVDPSVVAYGIPVDVQSAIPNATTAFTPTVAAAGTGFFAGKGVILLHMLVVGFFTLVVSSFLKFTGRGDLIPLVAFVGGSAILYEVIGLFKAIYDAISTLLNM